jgi:Kef-type K+ transport system membrane component KefB
VSTQPVFEQLLILMVVVWTVAVFLRRFGLPTIMGELVMGVIVGPTVLGWVEPSEIIEVLAQMGIFFLMLHTGVETEPRDFFIALRSSLGVALVGAVAPFSACAAIALAFGLSPLTALFVGLTMTATAVVVTLKVLRELRLNHTRMARVIMASCVIDDLLTLVLFSLVIGVLHGSAVSPMAIAWVLIKVLGFIMIVLAAGHYLYPLFRRPFRDRRGKGFTFLLILGLGFGLLAEAIGLHIILGAYMAGLFFREEVASRELIQKVEDRLKGIAYSFLGPIFFISLGFHISFDALTGAGLLFIITLTLACFAVQVVSAGGMSLRLGFSPVESLTVGIGMCGRAEMAFVLASIGLSMGVLDEAVFSVLIFTAFLLNLITPLGLRAITPRLRGEDGM